MESSIKTCHYSTQDFEDTARFTQFIRPEVDVLAIDACEGNAVIFNIGALGYLRVNYDDDNWDALRDELLLDHTRFDVRNRVQVRKRAKFAYN